LKDFKVLSRYMQKWIQPPACCNHGLHIILSSNWLAHFYLMKKIRQSAVLFWFVFQNSLLTSHNPKTINVSHTFLEHGFAEKIGVWAHANRDSNKQEVRFSFAWIGSELWTLIKYSKIKIKR
jgi:hypothetical protein